jgi:hypothetical protein
MLGILFAKPRYVIKMADFAKFFATFIVTNVMNLTGFIMGASFAF